jgi:chemotaxis protein CheY-P-specific phosphatase CheC
MNNQLLWLEVLNNTAPEGVLHTAIRHTAHSLSDMVGHNFALKNLRVKTMSIGQLSMQADDPETETVGIYLLLGDDLPGEAILILSLADAMYLADWLLEERPGTTTQLGDLECSALAEAGNQVLSSFLNALSEFIGTPLRLSPPAVMVDMLATVFEAVAMSAGAATDELLIIETELVNIESDLSLQFWVMPATDMQVVGVG